MYICVHVCVLGTSKVRTLVQFQLSVSAFPSDTLAMHCAVLSLPATYHTDGSVALLAGDQYMNGGL